MFIPPNRLQIKSKASVSTGSKVSLKASHLLIHHEIVAEVFGEELNVYVAYYPERRSLMIASISDDIFKTIHKAGQHMLKNRNLQGDKTIALHEILIDHQIDEENRDLEYEWQKGLGILNVLL